MERLEQESEQARAERLVAVLQAVPEYAVIGTDLAGVVRLFNEGAERLLGYTAPEVVGKRTLLEFHDPAEIAARAAQLGVPPLAAHLFIFYFGMLSLITPPDCLATYAAAAIARADFWKTGWTGMRLGIVAYVVPFVFVYHPALLLRGGAGEIAGAVLTAAAGVVLLAVGCAGYALRPLDWPRRTWAIAAAALLIAPPVPGVPALLTDALGLGAGALLLASEWLGARRRAAVAAVGSPGEGAAVAAGKEPSR